RASGSSSVAGATPTWARSAEASPPSMATAPARARSSHAGVVGWGLMEWILPRLSAPVSPLADGVTAAPRWAPHTGGCVQGGDRHATSIAAHAGGSPVSMKSPPVKRLRALGEVLASMIEAPSPEVAIALDRVLREMSTPRQNARRDRALRSHP